MTERRKTSRVKEMTANHDNSRICMPTWRNFKKVAYQSGLYEAQDVFIEVDNVDLVYLEPNQLFNFKEILQRKLIWRDVTKRLAFMNPGLQPVRLKKEYDLFVIICQSWKDLLYVNAIEGWEDHCRISVCYIDELWAGLVPSYKYWLHALTKFDHVILGLSGSVAVVADAIGQPCHYVAGGVDAIRFSPYPKPPARVIDVYSIGRRWENMHQKLLNLAVDREIFYVYDTLNAADMEAKDYRQHRDLLANMAKRSHFFMVGPAKMDDPEETHSQQEIGYRFFEGSAAGAVMIGKAPDCDAFHNLFDWPDAVIDISNEFDIDNLFSAIASQPERFCEISHRNSAEALLHHDWVYRWKQILNIAGLKPTTAMESREKMLKELAEMAIYDGCNQSSKPLIYCKTTK